ncbi:SpoIID/LytB domain-containing protein [Nostocoides sp. HKS02]|uniref:SpoIID/LytB domain-containing protein n=1 Tax=Nostocoides sp. HKS02 TaxID=1813880 RepID=UPI0018A82CE5|nr:SpoIID/LytB domain-containing protein [Tetrasphaera sp. HKS02]
MPRTPAVRRLAVLAVTGLAAALLPAAAASAESLPVPLVPSTQLLGHGYGHGHGMSQWGAYGAAVKGLTHQQIMAFYYPGTALVSTPASPIRVQLTGVMAGEVRVRYVAGLQLTANGTTTRLGGGTSAQPVDRWRLILDAGGTTQTLQWRIGTTWTSSGSLTHLAGPVTFANPTTGTVQLGRSDGLMRAYPGTLSSTPVNGSQVAVDNTVLETYLRGVVPNEMPASWLPAALRSQAIAARTYAAYEKQHPSSSVYDVCDWAACQVYDGFADYDSAGNLVASNTQPSSDAAIAATAGVMVSYNHAAAFTQFSASNGGWMTAGSVPYLVTKADPYDGVVANSGHTWTVSSSTFRSTLQSAYPSIGTLRTMIVNRDGNGDLGGRITTVTLVGSSGTVSGVTGEQLRSLFGLKSQWFTITNADFLRKDTTGDGRPDVFGLGRDGALWRFSATATAVTAPSSISAGWSVMSLIATGGDLRNVGTTDMLARDSRDGKVYCYPVPATGQMSSRTAVTAISASVDRLTGVGDATGDGINDVIGIDRTTGNLMLYPGTGSCALGAGRNLGGRWGGMDRIVGASDTNLDGRADFWVREASTGWLYTYRFNGSGALIAPAIPVSGGWNGYPDLVGVGDVNGGGGADLLARDTSGHLWLYPGKGDGTFGTRNAVTGDTSGMLALR